MKLLQESACMEKLKSQLTYEQLHRIQKDREKINKYKAGNPIRNVYQDTLTSRVGSYKNKVQGKPSNLDKDTSEANDDDQMNAEGTTDWHPTAKKK